MMKSVLTCFVAVLISLCALLNGVYGVGGTCGDDVTWDLDDDTHVMTISGSGAMDDYSEGVRSQYSMYYQKIESVVIEDGVTSVGSYAFYRLEYMKSVTLPSSVNRIGALAFAYLNNLENVTLPNALEVIEQEAFLACSSIKNVTIPATVNTIGTHAFAFCSKMTEIKVEEGNEFFESVDDVLFDSKTKALLQYPAGKQDFSYDIPDGTPTIGSGAFIESKNLVEVRIPESVTTIESDAFRSSGIVQVTIPDGITEIDSGVFFSCSELKRVTIPDSVTRFGLQCFEWCEELESIFLPPNTTFIGGNAFTGCNSLTTVTIPSGVKELRETAFDRCQSLTTVFFQGSEVVETPLFSGCPALEHICVTPQYEGASFGNHAVTPDDDICKSFKSRCNGCYAPYYISGKFERMTKTERAILWENQTNTCVFYQCDNQSGLIAWSSCNSSKDTSRMCMEDVCVDDWRNHPSAHLDYTYWMELTFKGLKYKDFSFDRFASEIKMFFNVHHLLDIGFEADRDGNVIRCVIYGLGESECEQLAALDKGPKCIYNYLCKVNEATAHSLGEVSGAESIHNSMMKGIIALFISIEMVMAFW